MRQKPSSAQLKTNGYWLLAGMIIAFCTCLMSFVIEDYKYGLLCLTLALFSGGYSLELFNKAANEYDSEQENGENKGNAEGSISEGKESSA